MQKGQKFIFTLILSTLLMSVASANIDNGKKIFDDKCRYCHSGNPPPNVSDAQGISVLARDATIRPETIISIIRNGTPDGMPSYNKNNISDIEIKDIVDYLKSIPNSIFPETPSATKNPVSNMTQAPVDTQKSRPKSPGFEVIFVGLIIIIVYIMRNRL